MLKGQQPEPKPPSDRIVDFRNELDAFIDWRAEALKAESPGVPYHVLRNILTIRADGCQCQAAQNIWRTHERRHLRRDLGR
jgi:hypothetical protein